MKITLWNQFLLVRAYIRSELDPSFVFKVEVSMLVLLLYKYYIVKSCYYLLRYDGKSGFQVQQSCGIISLTRHEVKYLGSSS